MPPVRPGRQGARAYDWAAWLVQDLLYPPPHRGVQCLDVDPLGPVGGQVVELDEPLLVGHGRVGTGRVAHGLPLSHPDGLRIRGRSLLGVLCSPVGPPDLMSGHGRVTTSWPQFAEPFARVAVW